MNDLTDLERRVLEMLLAGSAPSLKALREQLERASVSKREMTGVGFFTDFKVPADAARLSGQPSFELGDVDATADGLKYGLGFVLFVRDGALATLEGYSYGDEAWPERIGGLTLTYGGKPQRDVLKLEEALKGRQR